MTDKKLKNALSTH